MNKYIILLGLILLINTVNAKTINCLILTSKSNNDLPYTVGCIENQPCLSYTKVTLPRNIPYEWFTTNKILLYILGLGCLGILITLGLIGGNKWIIRK